MKRKKLYIHGSSTNFITDIKPEYATTAAKAIRLKTHTKVNGVRGPWHQAIFGLYYVFVLGYL